MKVRVLEPLPLSSGTIQPGQIIEVPSTVAEKLKGKLEPLEAPALALHPIDQQNPVEFNDGNQVITWRTGSGRTIFIAPSWAVEKYRRPGEAWFTPWEIVKLRAMHLSADTVERIIDGKEILGLEICGTC